MKKRPLGWAIRERDATREVPQGLKAKMFSRLLVSSITFKCLIARKKDSKCFISCQAETTKMKKDAKKNQANIRADDETIALYKRLCKNSFRSQSDEFEYLMRICNNRTLTARSSIYRSLVPVWFHAMRNFPFFNVTRNGQYIDGGQGIYWVSDSVPPTSSKMPVPGTFFRLTWFRFWFQVYAAQPNWALSSCIRSISHASSWRSRQSGHRPGFSG